MGQRTVAAAVGTGVTVFLVVAVGVIELLNVEFSAIVGLPVGLVAGAVTAVVVAARYDRLGSPGRYAVDAAAGFGLAVVGLLTLRYVNLAGLRSTLSVDVTAGVAVLGGVLAVIASWLDAR